MAAIKYGCHGIGVDCDDDAIADARAAVLANEVGDRVVIVQGDITQNLDCVKWEDVTVMFLFVGVASNMVLRDLVCAPHRVSPLPNSAVLTTSNTSLKPP